MTIRSFKQLAKDNEELIKTVKGLGETIEKLKSKRYRNGSHQQV